MQWRCDVIFNNVYWPVWTGFECTDVINLEMAAALRSSILFSAPVLLLYTPAFFNFWNLAVLWQCWGNWASVTALVNRHDRDKIQPCQYAEQIPTIVNSIRHAMQQLGIENLCKICNQSFKHKNSLVQHMKKHDVSSPYCYNCSYCSRQWQRPLSSGMSGPSR
jgi:hypothetical protein